MRADRVRGSRSHDPMLTIMWAAVEQASDVVMITDAVLEPPGPKIVYVNPAFTRMTGYSPAEVLGRSPRMLQGPQTDRAMLDRLRAACAAGECFDARTVNYRKDGTTYLVRWQIAPVRAAAGAISHFVAIQQDVTTLAQLEDRVQHAQKMEAIGRLAGGVAHDFNNLLTIITAGTRFAVEVLPSDHPATADLADVEAAAARAAALTRQLLAFSRQQVRRPETLDVNVIVANVERMLTRLIGEDVRLVTELTRGPVSVVADPAQLEQVLFNLAVNARDAMPDGGTMTIGTQVVAGAGLPDGQRPTGSAPDAPFAILSVADTGCGMDAATLERAFDPFFTTKGVGHGTGLGLATVHGIVEQSGGVVRIESAPGAGTRVRIALPLVERRATPRWAGHVVPPAGGLATVLLVEDDRAVRAVTKRVLARAGYAVIEARDSASALAAWHDSADGAGIDALVTDVVMPNGGGYDLMMQLRAARPQLPAVLVSGYAPDARVQSLLAAEGETTAFLEKPFHAGALSDQVARVLRAARAV